MNLAEFKKQMQDAMAEQSTFSLEFRARIVDAVPRTDSSNIVDVSTHVDFCSPGKAGSCHEVFCTAFQVTWELIASIQPAQANELAEMIRNRVAHDVQDVLISLDGPTEEATPEEHETMNHHIAFAKKTLDEPNQLKLASGDPGPDCDW